MTIHYKQSGFTLIETLIAASIFSSVILIGVATFTKMNQLNDRSSELRAAAEDGRFAMDTMTRTISSATGDSNFVSAVQGGSSPRMQSVQLCNNASLVPIASEQVSPIGATGFAVATADTDQIGESIMTVKHYQYDSSTKQIGIVTHRYAIDPTTGAYGFPKVGGGGSAAPSITSNAVTIESFNAFGVSAQTTNTAQPFITIKMTVKAVPLRTNTTGAVQEFRSSTVDRDYNWNLVVQNTNIRNGSNLCGL